MNLSLLQVSEWTAGERSPAVDSNAIATGYSIDSRTLERGDLFFAVKGDRFDGHDFVEPALSRGAVAAVIAKSHSARFAQSHLPLILVDDTLTALQHLASAGRRKWGKRVIGITGSAGDDDQRSDRDGTREKIQRAQVKGQSEQRVRNAAAAFASRTGTRYCGNRDRHVVRR